MQLIIKLYIIKNKNSMNENNNEHLLSSMVIMPVKHIFSDQELLEKSNEIAQKISEKEYEEGEKKSIASEYKNKIDKLQAEIKLISGHINNKYAYFDKPCELVADFENKKRVYRLKDTGEVVKTEDLHPADYNTLQTKLELEEQENLLETARQEQIAENNTTGDFAEGTDPFATIDDIIVDKKVKGAKKAEKPTPKPFLPDNYGANFEQEDELPE